VLILIDGYNVLKGVARGGEVSSKERDYFIAQLSSYAARKRHKIIVVFDGGPYGWAHKEQRRAITVVFTGARESADDLIRRYLKKYRGQDLLLVSSDRELNYNASRYDVPSIDSEDFYGLMEAALERHDLGEESELACDAIKTTDDSSPELDKLMQEASVAVPHKSEDQPTTATAAQDEMHGLSRLERRLLEKLKKL